MAMTPQDERRSHIQTLGWLMRRWAAASVLFFLTGLFIINAGDANPATHVDMTVHWDRLVVGSILGGALVLALLGWVIMIAGAARWMWRHWRGDADA